MPPERPQVGVGAESLGERVSESDGSIEGIERDIGHAQTRGATGEIKPRNWPLGTQLDQAPVERERSLELLPGRKVPGEDM
jgi:hypothetical protein